MALAAPGLADAASLTVDKECYAPGDAVNFAGAGFTPSGAVAISVEGQQLGTGDADAAGAFTLGLTAPTIDGRQRTDTFTATDQTNLAVTASVPVKLTSLDVRIKPKDGNPGRKKRITARGFTDGKTLYAHVRRGKLKRNIKIGRLKGACKTLNVKKRLFSPDAKSGIYKVFFDTRRRYSAKTDQSIGFQVLIYRTLAPASASSAGGERWLRLR
jgi:hypothetical protein